MRNDYLCVVIRGKGDEPFKLNSIDGRSLDCGYIETDEKTLKKVFFLDDVKFILEFCEKIDDDGLHCSAKNNSEYRGKLKVFVEDGIEFCCHA